jgi:hypothetical protein
MAKPSLFEYEGLPKLKDKEGFGNDFTKLTIEQSQSDKERMPEGCHYKEVVDPPAASRKFGF